MAAVAAASDLADTAAASDVWLSLRHRNRVPYSPAELVIGFPRRAPVLDVADAAEVCDVCDVAAMAVPAVLAATSDVAATAAVAGAPFCNRRPV